MNARYLSWVVVAALAVGSQPAVADLKEKTDPQEQLKTAIPEAIRLLEAKEHKKLIQKFAHPDEVKKIIQNSSLDEVAKQFGEGKAAELLKVLKEVKDQKPTLNADGDQATYKPKSGGRQVVFAKVGKLWHIKN